MKKFLITIFSMCCIALLVVNNLSYAKMTNINVHGGFDYNMDEDIDFKPDPDERTEQGMGANLFNSSLIRIDKESNIMYYDGWVKLKNFMDHTYYLTIDGVEPVDQELDILFANEEDGGSDFGTYEGVEAGLCSDSICIFGFKVEKDTFRKDDIVYFSFRIRGYSVTFDKDDNYYKDKVYLNDATLMPNYYTPYFYDSSCLSYSEAKVNGIVENDFVTSTSKKVNIEKLKSAIKSSDDYVVELVSDEYTNNYNVAGKYTITFNVTKDNKNETVKFVATVISLGSITYNGTNEASYTYNVSTNIGELEFIENLPSEIINDFTFDMSSGIVKRRFVFDDADITGDGVDDKIINFQEICKVPGIYSARWELYSEINGTAVEDSYNITITIIDDSKIEVFVPKFVIYLNPEKTYTQEELANQIKNLLVVNNIFDGTSTVSITSNEYEANSTTEGEYKVGYRVSQGDHIYDESCTVNVSLNNSYEPEIVITNDSGFNPSIIYITITIVLALGISTHFAIKKVKNRKNH